MDDLTSVLVIEDEKEIREMIVNHLKADHFNVVEAADGEEALAIFSKNDFDLILMDMMLPKISGKKVMAHIRERCLAPLLIISAKDSETDKILGLELGADDYITKPFSMGELNARIHALLRRAGYSYAPSKETAVRLGRLELNMEDYSLIKPDRKVSLTAKEFEILKLFFTYPKKVFTKAQIYSSVWMYDYVGDDNAVFVHISRLRDKIEDDSSDPTIIKTALR
ncbi:response regulator transcription factor [Paenibacillus sp. 79R4]|uniref:response regulator transcription factor n=1 Tax=Paenibacillus sp. 79R4 TaxID=2212847 RepID=UPI003569DEEC